MLNIGRRRKAMESLRNATVAYHDALGALDDGITRLNHRRHAGVSEFADPFFECITELANPPRRLKKAARRFKESISIFNGNVARVHEKSLPEARKMQSESMEPYQDMSAVDSAGVALAATMIVLTERSASVLADHSEFQSAITLLEEAGIPLRLEDGLELAKGTIRASLSSAEPLSVGWSMVKVGFAVNGRNKQMALAAETLNAAIDGRTEIYQTAAVHARTMNESTAYQSSQASDCVRHLGCLHHTDFNKLGNKDKVRVNDLASHVLELSKLLNMQITLLRGSAALMERAPTWFRPHENIYAIW